MYGLLEENGPCYANSDSNSTRLSEWSWNNEGKCVHNEVIQTNAEKYSQHAVS